MIDVVASAGGATTDAIITSNGGPWARFADVGLSAYYSDSRMLSGIAVDAISGPQVLHDSRELVGRAPSGYGAWIENYTELYDLRLRYSEEGIPSSPDLGFLMRVQRAGDVVLTRPVFVIEGWLDSPYDSIPRVEWNTF
ncbi:hypothetical protein [Catenuloplanes indicus]|uniref:Uncharacterized protein n=1 Tax=Catenuloplanes indicus TaxID=137267 RepID=A0AAE3VZY2_9ACTN|nr:hypothetical protein [Catenuloplanes indicus]MDQ0366791.1 hypothetical protein [Catenuloplanes indicus]